MQLLTAHTHSKTPRSSCCLWSDSCHLCPLRSGSLLLGSYWWVHDILPNPPFYRTVHTHTYTTRADLTKGSQEKQAVS